MLPPLFMVIVPADGEKFAPVPTVKAPLTPKLLAVVTVAELAIERLLKVNVPELTMELPLFMVIVPAVGAKVLRALTVNAPLTENELVG